MAPVSRLPDILRDLPDRPSGAPEVVSAAVAEELDALSPLEMRIGYTFARPALLRVALTHRSWALEHPKAGWAHNAVLEFLGDAVLDLVAADRIWRKFPELSEGALTRLRATIVSRPALSEAARGVGLGPWLYLGRGLERQGGRDHDRVLADAVEAVLGAVFLDAREAGRDPLGASEAVFERLLGERLAELSAGDGYDPKSLLAHAAQTRFRVPPRYVVEGERPEPGAPWWRVRVEVAPPGQDALVLGTGVGRSQRVAQRRAAAAALERLERLDEPEGGGEGEPASKGRPAGPCA